MIFLFQRLVSSLKCPPWMFPPCKRLISQVSLFLSTAPLCRTLWEFISVCSRYVRKSLAFSVDLNVTCSFCRWFSFECYYIFFSFYFLCCFRASLKQTYTEAQESICKQRAFLLHCVVWGASHQQHCCFVWMHVAKTHTLTLVCKC